ncbi:ATPase, AAA-type, core, P-loop containing nucleoside triphosphate hydrolase [Tanacetum coccineum]
MNVSFNELLGVDDIIHEFQDIISILHGKSEHKNFRSKLPIGVFLYGPPGTGKCTLAHAMAREANVPFFCLSACYIRRGDVRIKSLFYEARRCSPSIVFIDDVDEIASKRENYDSDPNLVELQTEMEKCNKDGIMVVVIVATYSPETLDSTFMSLKWAHLENLVVESRVAAKYRRGGGHVTIDDVHEAIRGYDNFITIMKMIELHNNPCDS